VQVEEVEVRWGLRPVGAQGPAIGGGVQRDDVAGPGGGRHRHALPPDQAEVVVPEPVRSGGDVIWRGRQERPGDGAVADYAFVVEGDAVLPEQVRGELGRRGGLGGVVREAAGGVEAGGPEV